MTNSDFKNSNQFRALQEARANFAPHIRHSHIMATKVLSRIEAALASRILTSRDKKKKTKTALPRKKKEIPPAIVPPVQVAPELYAVPLSSPLERRVIHMEILSKDNSERAPIKPSPENVGPKTVKRRALRYELRHL